MQANIYAHFHADEREFVDKAIDWIQRSLMYHEVRTTDFLDPRQIQILQSLLNRESDLQMLASGGYPAAERKRVQIAPDYVVFDTNELPIEVLSITSTDARFPGLEHGDFLGAILGLGIKRDKIGDIHVHEMCCHVVVASEMAEYLDTHLNQVHRAQVFTERLSIEHLKPTQAEFEEVRLSVASMRLDGIVSDVIRVSRAKVLAPIKAGRCKVNWKVVEDPSYALCEGDVVSLQGFGRFKLMSIEGQSKSGRIRLIVGKYT